jgi:hypothetical protein
MNGEAADHDSLVGMIEQTWPNPDDEFSRDLRGILTADSGALVDLAADIDDRSATPDDAYGWWCALVESIDSDDLAELGDWDGQYDGCNTLRLWLAEL